MPKNSLQYHRRPDWRIWVWNLGSVSVMGREFCEELRYRMIDVCRLEDLRWRGQGARMLGVNVSCGGLEKVMELVVWELW